MSIVTQVMSVRIRFAGVVYPGETLITQMWKEGDKVLFSELFVFHSCAQKLSRSHPRSHDCQREEQRRPGGCGSNVGQPGYTSKGETLSCSPSQTLSLYTPMDCIHSHDPLLRVRNEGKTGLIVC